MSDWNKAASPVEGIKGLTDGNTAGPTERTSLLEMILSTEILKETGHQLAAKVHCQFS